MNAISEQLNLFDQNYRELTARFDHEYGVLWAHMNPGPIPCFTRGIFLVESARSKRADLMPMATRSPPP